MHVYGADNSWSSETECCLLCPWRLKISCLGDSGSTDETFRNTVEPFCSACSPCTVEVVQQRALHWKAGSDSSDEVSLAHSFHIEAMSLQLGSS